MPPLCGPVPRGIFLCPYGQSGNHLCIVRCMNIKTYTRNEVTEILQVSLTTVGTLINQGDIFSIKVGKSIRVPEWALRDYLMGKPAYKAGDPISEPDYHDLSTDSIFKDSGNDS